MSTQLYLASNSARRIELLRARGFCFKIRTPAVAEPEPRLPGQIPEHWAEALSYFKARSVARELTSGFVLGADTVVAHEDAIIGKPADIEDARRILSRLAGTTHRVITGVTLLDVHEGRRWIRHDVTTVTMRPLTSAALEAYLESGLWDGKAGAYGIQDQSDANIERLDGSYTNVVGLPMEVLEHMLEEAGILSAVIGSAAPSHHPDPLAGR